MHHPYAIIPLFEFLLNPFHFVILSINCQLILASGRHCWFAFFFFPRPQSTKVHTTSLWRSSQRLLQRLLPLREFPKGFLELLWAQFCQVARIYCMNMLILKTSRWFNRMRIEVQQHVGWNGFGSNISQQICIWVLGSYQVMISVVIHSQVMVRDFISATSYQIFL